MTCVGGGIFCVPNQQPSPETCDGLDNDCDGPVDEPHGGVPLCDDENPCTDDFCTGIPGCLYGFNAAPCDDGDGCTAGDACTAGRCIGSAVGPPAEVGNQRFSSKTVQTWNPVIGTPAAVYDVVRGNVGEWPVGSGVSEQCRAYGVNEPELNVAEDPTIGTALWFLVRARTVCGTGSYGIATGPGPGPTPRISSACP